MPAPLDALPLPQLLGLVAAFWIGLSFLGSVIGFLCERLRAGPPIWDVPLRPGQYRLELVGTAGFLAVQIAAFTLVLRAGWIRFGEGPGWLTFGIQFFAFQIYYYGLHRLMHLRPLLFLHRWHHESHVTTPLTGHSMSVGEALGWSVGYLGLPMLQALVVPVSFWGLFGYVLFNAMGNLIGHANFESLPRQFITRTGALLMPPFLFHALHHARWTGHYGFESAWLDRLFGTEWPDWQPLHRAIMDGHPLTSLKARGDTETAADGR